MKRTNRDGAPPSAAPTLSELDANVLAARLGDGETTVVDTRSSVAFTAGFIAGTINIPGSRSFTNWAGSLLSPDADIILIADDESRARALVRELSLIGLDRVRGWAKADVVNQWQSAGRRLQRARTINSRDLAALDEALVIDVRAESEWDGGHIPGARHIFLGDLVDAVDELPRDRPLVIACQGGSRSSIGTSLLRARGFENVINLSGGFGGWQEAGLPVETGDATTPSH